MRTLRIASAALAIFGMLVILGTAGALEHNMSMTLNKAISQIALGNVLVVIGALGMGVTYK